MPRVSEGGGCEVSPGEGTCSALTAMSSDFFLQPLDGGPRVPVGPGQTVIGRGPLLGITDKRVSRRHAILEVVDSQLRIKPLHRNPCFYQSSEEKSQLSPMETHVWSRLHPGDSFSLLLDKYAFRVFSAEPEEEMECTLRNSQMLDEDDILSEMQKSPVVNLPDKTTGASQLQGSPEITKTKCPTIDPMSSSGECRAVSEHQPNPTQRKRILPAWMLAESLSDQSLSTPVEGGDKDVIQRTGKEGTCGDKTPVNTSWHGRKRFIPSGNSKSVSAEQDPGKKCRKSDQEGPGVSSEDVPESSFSVTVSGPDVDIVKTNKRSDATSIEELDEVSKYKAITKPTTNKEVRTVSHPESQSKLLPEKSQGCHPESSSAPSSPDASHTDTADSVRGCSEESKVRRTSCMYGANCYRKNPLHFQHFSHPGDSDYGDEHVTDEGVTGDRPECPYGASCYRKNPQHKMEYRHSALPARVSLDEDDDGAGQLSDDEDEEDEPTDEDSDWQPGKEDEEEEDVEELLKEAKRFMRRKK
ncbi:aprataxin and PNK-like factor isoform X2 [Arvicanthis niloticus]|uniref:aprataxin and PNK-like factor isoform X2 n=1 Tax=Arvicanthis niloticus TaxID=61156 RepID=UPI001485DE54|nr:aprataxin and PNK-like factor [Arvicanthis niloticus]